MGSIHLYEKCLSARVFFFQQMALNPRGSFIFGVGHGFWGHGGEYA